MATTKSKQEIDLQIQIAQMAVLENIHSHTAFYTGNCPYKGKMIYKYNFTYTLIMLSRKSNRTVPHIYVLHNSWSNISGSISINHITVTRPQHNMYHQIHYVLNSWETSKNQCCCPQASFTRNNTIWTTNPLKIQRNIFLQGCIGANEASVSRLVIK